MNEDRMRELFRQLRDEPVPADSLVRVRMRVAQRTAKRRVQWWLAAAAVAACVVMVALWTGHETVEVPSPAVAAVVPKAPEVHLSQPQTAVVTKPVRLAAPVALDRKAPQQDVLIRIETADPDVVLYFVAGE